MAVDQEEHPFDAATESCEEVNEMLADTDGGIAEMSFNGAIGYHIYVAQGETSPEYLWRVAFLQALEESVMEALYVDGETANEARRQLERQIRDAFDPMTAEYVADQFEQKLRNLIETQGSQ